MRRPGPAAAGIALTLVSAATLSTLGIATQLAFAAGASVGTVLPGRFLLGAAILWALVWIRGRALPSRRRLAGGLLLGAGYSGHAWLFASSLTRLDAGLVDLLLFTYPALVVLGSLALRRERWSSRRAIALASATAGTSLVLAGGLGDIDAIGVLLALGSALAYAAYILVSAGQLERTDPFLLTALVTTGAAITLAAAGVARHDVSLQLDAAALALIAATALIAVTGMTTFIAGLARLGPSRASIVSAVQPALTPVLGFAVFADRLGPAQVLGGALVVGAVVILEAGGRRVLDWLPRRERWRLRRLADALDVPAGGCVLRQGTPGDAFFVIRRGSARVRRGDRDVAELGPGDFFGEVALLSGGPRTASVQAATDLRVHVLRRGEFTRAMQRLPTLARNVSEAATLRRGTAAPGTA